MINKLLKFIKNSMILYDENFIQTIVLMPDKYIKTIEKSKIHTDIIVKGVDLLFFLFFLTLVKSTIDNEKLVHDGGNHMRMPTNNV